MELGKKKNEERKNSQPIIQRNGRVLIKQKNLLILKNSRQQTQLMSLQKCKDSKIRNWKTNNLSEGKDTLFTRNNYYGVFHLYFRAQQKDSGTCIVSAQVILLSVRETVTDPHTAYYLFLVIHSTENGARFQSKGNSYPK